MEPEPGQSGGSSSETLVFRVGVVTSRKMLNAPNCCRDRGPEGGFEESGVKHNDPTGGSVHCAKPLKYQDRDEAKNMGTGYYLPVIFKMPYCIIRAVVCTSNYLSLNCHLYSIVNT